MAELICSCDNIYPGELYDNIKMAYEKDLVDDAVINMDDIDSTFKLGKSTVLDLSRNNTSLQFVDDTIGELEWWACFNKNKENRGHKTFTETISNSTQSPVKKIKVGRNDPCPCGSGKKYKKCCGK